MTQTPPPEPTDPFLLSQLAAPQPPPRRRRTGLIAAAAGGAVLLVAMTAAATIALTRGDTTKPSESKKAVDVTGFIRLPVGGWLITGSGCAGSGGYSDIAEGTPVAVTDSGGKTVALGKLKAGGTSGVECIFHFDVYPVPAGLGFYGVEVSHRGRVQFKESELTGIKLSLG